MDRFDINSFTKHFKDRDVFETADISEFYCSASEQTKATATINWRIHSLVKKGVLQRVGRGIYRFGKATIYIPEISPKLKSLYGKIKKKFPFTGVCLWHTSVFNEFMQHQAGKYYYLVEVEKESAEAIFYFLKEKNLSVFLNPNREILDKYIPENKDVYIVKPLISEAPVQETCKIITATLEKILVDIFCDETLFTAQQGAEMRTIFNEAFGVYTVNQSKMLRYADRRKKKAVFGDYLKTVSNYRQHIQNRAIL